jgi:hypothetical protein
LVRFFLFFLFFLVLPSAAVDSLPWISTFIHSDSISRMSILHRTAS